MNMTVTERHTLTVVRAAWLFDGTHPVLTPDPVIVHAGGRILAVDRAAPPPAGAVVVDLPGATLLPGLVDTHVHLAFDASTDPVGRLAQRTDTAALAAMAAAARQAVRGGVTTVRDLGDRGYLSLALRAAAGSDPSLPTIVAAGPPITTPAGHCHYLGATAAGAEEVRREVRAHADRGVDVIKIMASGGRLTAGTRPELAQFGPAELRAAVDEAHRHSLPVTAHAHGTQAVANAVAAGADGLEHASFMTADGVDDAPDDLVRAIAANRIVVGFTMGIAPLRAPRRRRGSSPGCRPCWPTPGACCRPARRWPPGRTRASDRSSRRMCCAGRPGSSPGSASPRPTRFSPAPPRRPPCAAWPTARAASLPATTPTSSPSTATPSSTRPRCTTSEGSTPADKASPEIPARRTTTIDAPPEPFSRPPAASCPDHPVTGMATHARTATERTRIAMKTARTSIRGRRACLAARYHPITRGARPYLQTCHRELAAAELAAAGPAGPQTAPALPGLTPAEQRVARLDATGRTNRQTAAKLYVSVKTVEFHLGHIFDKLGIRSRKDLITRTGSPQLPRTTTRAEPRAGPGDTASAAG